MAEKSYPWPGVTPVDGDDAGQYTAEQWWGFWGTIQRAAAIISPSAGSPLRTLASLTNVGVYYSVENRLEVTDAGGLVAQVNTGAAIVEGGFYYADAAVNLTLPASQTDYYIVLRKNYTGSNSVPPGYVSGDGIVGPYTTRLTWVSAIVQSTDQSTFWDIPLAKFTTDGSSITSLTDEREWADLVQSSMWIPALVGYNTTDATDIALSISDNQPYCIGLKTIAAKDSEARSHAVCPEDYVTGFLVNTVVMVETGSGDMYGRTLINYGACGEDMEDKSTTTSSAAHTLASGTFPYDRINCEDEVEVTDIDPGDIIHIEFEREGSNVLDTANDVHFMGWKVDYYRWL